VVYLTAPSTAGDNNFQKWQRNGVDYSTNQSTNVTMDANYTMTANFSTTIVSYTINPNAPYSYIYGNNQITSWQGNLDDGYFDLPLSGFDFQFYGLPVTNIRVSTNGYITFGMDGMYWNNVAIPDVSPPNAIIAPFWDDLYLNGLTGERGVWWDILGTAPNRQLVIEWYQVPSYDYRTEMYSFEIILYESTDRIKFQYLDIDSGTSHDLGASATIGIENFDGTGGVQYSYNTSSLSNNQAIEFIPEEVIQNTIYVSGDGFCSGNYPCFPNIQNGIVSASAPSAIEITQETYNEDIILDFDELIFLQGGWDTNFTSNSSYTTIDGSITITNGKMIVERIILK
jgi:hypothetical protein